MTMKITALYVYPIKGLRGIELETAQIRPQGISHDRTFMLYEVRPPGDKLEKIQLDTHPRCALFEQQIVPKSQAGDEAAALVVRFRGVPGTGETDESVRETLRVPLEPDMAALEKIDIRLHDSPAAAYRMGDACDAWFSRRFGVPAMMVYLGDGRRSVLGKSLVPRAAAEQQQQQQQRGWMTSLTSYITGAAPSSDTNSPAPWLTFTDVAPLLVTSEPSRQDVSERLLGGQAVEMYKFRPNIVVDGEGEDAWAEDFWAELEVETQTREPEAPRKQTLQLTGNCVRCLSLNVDYRTGKPAEGEQGNVLKRLMKDRRVDPGSKWSPVFGRYAFPDSHAEGFTVSVGDGVEVSRRNAERTVFDWPNM
ncbi:hypothetical protein BT67DRAFT_430802 [Trichocladium antarcticum]|uniref:MOSC domain-containing protein n=1 Tax=Trichocladium antarcticum TaxID=1450529 RepID=A0AAN6USI9_9PEZI|nr:hypothetical protein BT67DRAFT_430802 [Trichocladium antarcticum]